MHRATKATTDVHTWIERVERILDSVDESYVLGLALEMITIDESTTWSHGPFEWFRRRSEDIFIVVFTRYSTVQR